MANATLCWLVTELSEFKKKSSDSLNDTMPQCSIAIFENSGRAIKSILGGTASDILK
jgi:hypothetical protein